MGLAYPEYAGTEVVESAMRFTNGKQQLDKIVGFVHVGNAFVQCIHHQQSVVFQSAARAKVSFVDRTKLLEHCHYVVSCLKHSAIVNIHPAM